jgi:hypothetical protein
MPSRSNISKFPIRPAYVDLEREIELFLEKRKQFAERQIVACDPSGDIGKTIVSGDVRAGVSKARLNDAARRLDRDRRAALGFEKI